MGQTSSNESNLLLVTDVSKVVDSQFSKSQLYSNARKWVLSTYADYKSVIQNESPEEGQIALKGREDLKTKKMDEANAGFTYETITYTIVIDCKDKKYRYKISDIRIESKHWILSSDREISKEISPSYHITDIHACKSIIEDYKTKIDIIRSEPKISKKGEKQISEYNRLIALEENDIETSISFCREEYGFIQKLSNSIEIGMRLNDSF